MVSTRIELKNQNGGYQSDLLAIFFSFDLLEAQLMDCNLKEKKSH